MDREEQCNIKQPHAAHDVHSGRTGKKLYHCPGVNRPYKNKREV